MVIRAAQALPLEARTHLAAELVDRLLDRWRQGVVQLGLERPLADRAHVRQTHAVGREHARERVHQDLLEAEVRDQTGVLAGRAAEATSA